MRKEEPSFIKWLFFSSSSNCYFLLCENFKSLSFIPKLIARQPSWRKTAGELWKIGHLNASSGEAIYAGSVSAWPAPENWRRSSTAWVKMSEQDDSNILFTPRAPYPCSTSTAFHASAALAIYTYTYINIYIYVVLDAALRDDNTFT